ncbi:hut operon transcriptional regulator HutP, partial [Vibrio cholerae]|nr:hut operon transcriptional regulator HutP [Vibrio cholerae]
NESPVLSIPKGWKYCTGKVGSMNSQKVVAAMETAAKSNQVIETDVYRETHALYHAIMEALYGVTRGQIQLADVLRTV